MAAAVNQGGAYFDTSAFGLLAGNKPFGADAVECFRPRGGVFQDKRFKKKPSCRRVYKPQEELEKKQAYLAFDPLRQSVLYRFMDSSFSFLVSGRHIGGARNPDFGL